jgi:hypothetical protein
VLELRPSTDFYRSTLTVVVRVFIVLLRSVMKLTEAKSVTLNMLLLHVFSELRSFVAFAMAIIRAWAGQRSTISFLVSVVTIVLL